MNPAGDPIDPEHWYSCAEAARLLPPERSGLLRTNRLIALCQAGAMRSRKAADGSYAIKGADLIRYLQHSGHRAPAGGPRTHRDRALPVGGATEFIGMASEFKVGDRVRLTQGTKGYQAGDKGTVVSKSRASFTGRGGETYVVAMDKNDPVHTAVTFAAHEIEPDA
jgi:hypothetical protein